MLPKNTPKTLNLRQMIEAQNNNSVQDQGGNSSKPLLDAVFGNSEEQILKIQSKSVDIICIDPPYLYLKNQKLERPFDENLFFQQCNRILKNNGFIILFGRGTSFYRWNCILEKLGLEFKEEIVWDKGYTSSPVLALSRVHETISILGKGKAKIKESRIPYLEQKNFNFSSIHQDLKRIKSSLSNPESLQAMEKYLISSEIDYNQGKKMGFNATITGVRLEQDRSVKTFQSIITGMKEKSIVRENRLHNNTIHPTQKPTRLLERLLLLCLPDKPKEEIQIVDFFAGSFSCGEACYNLGINFKGFEIDEEYYNAGVERLRKIQFQTSLF